MKKRFLTILGLLFLVCSCQTNSNFPTDSSSGNVSKQNFDSKELYNILLKEFNDLYTNSYLIDNQDLKIATLAKAEAYLLDSGVVVPFSSEDVEYSLTRILPHTKTNITLNGCNYNYKNILISTDLLSNDEANKINDVYQDCLINSTLDKYYDYLKENYNLTDKADFVCFDELETLNPFLELNKDNQIILRQCFASLFDYDAFDNITCSLAESYSVSTDGLVYTIKINQQAKYYTYDGKEYGNIKAIDFVNGYKYYLSCGNICKYIKNSQEYISDNVDFSKVGIEALNDYTLKITLSEKVNNFLSILTSFCLLPLNEDFYLANKDNFGDILHPESMLYTGSFYPSLISSEKVVLKRNTNYFDSDKTTLNSMLFSFVSQDDETLLNQLMEGKYSDLTLDNNSLLLDTLFTDTNIKDYININVIQDTVRFSLLNVNRTSFVETDEIKTIKTDKEIENAFYALQNKNFRKALMHSIDRKSYNIAKYGDNVGNYNIRNTFTPIKLTRLKNDITIDGKTFYKNTNYGEIVNYYFKQLGNDVDINNETIDAYYNKDVANEYLNKAIEELNLSTTDKIILDVLCYSKQSIKMASLLKDNINSTFNGKVDINLIICSKQFDYFDALYSRCYDILLDTAWQAEFYDPSTYLKIFSSNGEKLNDMGLM